MPEKRTRRRENDVYPTPRETTLAILERLQLPGGHWLEPSAGHGAIVQAVNSVRQVYWVAAELRDECIPALAEIIDPTTGVAVQADFLDPHFNLDAFTVDGFRVAILNPPFALALPFIERCLSVADWVVCLERLNFIGTQKRGAWMRQHMPDVYVLPERPSFTSDGTDSCEYAWLVWPPDGHDRGAGKVEVLPSRQEQSGRQIQMGAR